MPGDPPAPQGPVWGDRGWGLGPALKGKQPVPPFPPLHRVRGSCGSALGAEVALQWLPGRMGCSWSWRASLGRSRCTERVASDARRWARCGCGRNRDRRSRSRLDLRPVGWGNACAAEGGAQRLGGGCAGGNKCRAPGNERGGRAEKEAVEPSGGGRFLAFSASLKCPFAAAFAETACCRSKAHDKVDTSRRPTSRRQRWRRVRRAHVRAVREARSAGAGWAPRGWVMTSSARDREISPSAMRRRVARRSRSTRGSGGRGVWYHERRWAAWRRATGVDASQLPRTDSSRSGNACRGFVGRRRHLRSGAATSQARTRSAGRPHGSCASGSRRTIKFSAEDR